MSSKRVSDCLGLPNPPAESAAVNSYFVDQPSHIGHYGLGMIAISRALPWRVDECSAKREEAKDLSI
jgi:hypothetical protein